MIGRPSLRDLVSQGLPQYEAERLIERGVLDDFDRPIPDYVLEDMLEDAGFTDDLDPDDQFDLFDDLDE